MDEAADRRCRAPRRAVTAAVIRCFPCVRRNSGAVGAPSGADTRTRSTKRTRSLTFSSLPPHPGQRDASTPRVLSDFAHARERTSQRPAAVEGRRGDARRLARRRLLSPERTRPPISVAVLRGCDTLVMKGYGDASVEAHRAATASTVYRIGSITKQFTSAAIMRLRRAWQAVDRRPDLEVPPGRAHARPQRSPSAGFSTTRRASTTTPPNRRGARPGPRR